MSLVTTGTCFFSSRFLLSHCSLSLGVIRTVNASVQTQMSKYNQAASSRAALLPSLLEIDLKLKRMHKTEEVFQQLNLGQRQI